MQTLIHRDSKPWQVRVWASFLIAVFLCAVGLSYLPGRDVNRAFMVMGYFFCLSAAFVLTKCVRDQEKTQTDVMACRGSTFVVWGSHFSGDGAHGLHINASRRALVRKIILL